MVVSLASTGGAAKIYCVNGGGMTSKNAAAWLEAKLTDRNKRRKRGGQGGTGGEGEIRLIQVRAAARNCSRDARALTTARLRRTLTFPRRRTRSRRPATEST